MRVSILILVNEPAGDENQPRPAGDGVVVSILILVKEPAGDMGSFFFPKAESGCLNSYSGE